MNNACMVFDPTVWPIYSVHYRTGCFKSSLLVQRRIASCAEVSKVSRTAIITGGRFTARNLGWAIVNTLASFILVEYLDRGCAILDAFAEVGGIHAAQQGALALDLAFREVKFAECARQSIGTIVDAGVSLGEPRVLETVIHADPLLDIHSKHPVDQVQCRVSHGVPVWRWVVKSTHLDLLCECVGVLWCVQLIGKWRESAKTNVENHPK